MEGLTGHKIDGAILHLYHYVSPEFSVQRNKIIVSLFVPVNGVFVTIHKRPPDNNSFKRSDGIGQHISAICMCSFVILGTWLSLTVCFNQKTAEIRNVSIY